MRIHNSGHGPSSPHPAVHLQGRPKEDKSVAKRATFCAASALEDEASEEYVLTLMQLRQRRERVYDHFENMIAGHKQVRSAAVELCLSAINTSRVKLESLVNPALKRTAQFDGFDALDNLYKSYIDHALRTDFATEIIEQADRDPSHELYWCARQLLRLKHSSYKNYQKYKYLASVLIAGKPLKCSYGLDGEQDILGGI